MSILEEVTLPATAKCKIAFLRSQMKWLQKECLRIDSLTDSVKYCLKMKDILTENEIPTVFNKLNSVFENTIGMYEAKIEKISANKSGISSLEPCEDLITSLQKHAESLAEMGQKRELKLQETENMKSKNSLIYDEFKMYGRYVASMEPSHRILEEIRKEIIQLKIKKKILETKKSEISKKYEGNLLLPGIKRISSAQERSLSNEMFDSGVKSVFLVKQSSDIDINSPGPTVVSCSEKTTRSTQAGSIITSSVNGEDEIREEDLPSEYSNNFPIIITPPKSDIDSQKQDLIKEGELPLECSNHIPISISPPKKSKDTQISNSSQIFPPSKTPPLEELITAGKKTSIVVDLLENKTLPSLRNKLKAQKLVNEKLKAQILNHVGSSEEECTKNIAEQNASLPEWSFLLNNQVDHFISDDKSIDLTKMEMPDQSLGLSNASIIVV